MDDDEDDLYDTPEPAANGTGTITQAITSKHQIAEDEEEQDSDDDIEFTIEKPETAKTDVAASTRQSTKAEPTSQPAAKRARTSEPAPQNPAEPQSIKASLTHNGKEGKDFPEVRTSTVDTDADPVWPADDKRITDVDIDADLAEHSKPWRLPGTDQTDFFNYGFDEYTWTQYCAKQKSMSQTIGDLKDEDAKMKAMLGGAPADGGMDMMAMFSAMMGGGQGMSDPSKMDFSQFANMPNMGAMGMPGMPPTGVFPGQQGGASPMPQGGQGFQPPSGPSGHQDGYGQQQEQQGGGRRGRRGRGGYNNF